MMRQMLIWIGMGSAATGTALMTAVGLLWPAQTRFHDWSFRVGLALMLLGCLALIVSG